MTTSTATDSPEVKGARLTLLIGGLAAVAFGIAVLVWPTKTAVAVAGVLAIYVFIAGIVYIALGFLAKQLGTGGRIGHVVLGILYLLAGIFAFRALTQTAAFIAVFVTVMIGFMWIVEGIVSLFTIGAADSKVLTIVFAIISIIAGVTLLGSPLFGAVFLWWFLGISLVVLGALNVIRAVFRKK